MSTEKNVKPRMRIGQWAFVPRPRYGFRCVTGILLEDHHTNLRLREGVRTYSSRIVHVDLDINLIETEYTLYELVGDAMEAPRP